MHRVFKLPLIWDIYFQEKGAKLEKLCVFYQFHNISGPMAPTCELTIRQWEEMGEKRGGVNYPKFNQMRISNSKISDFSAAKM